MRINNYDIPPKPEEDTMRSRPETQDTAQPSDVPDWIVQEFHTAYAKGLNFFLVRSKQTTNREEGTIIAVEGTDPEEVFSFFFRSSPLTTTEVP
jgi:hypothetical protein